MKHIWNSVALLLVAAVPVIACGPWFPPTVLDRPEEPLRAPSFYFDLSELLPTNSTWRAAGEFADVTELHADDACLAAYREGRALLGTDDRQAAAALRRVRTLLENCSSPDCGLAAASIGWEARAELDLGNLIRAGELYMEHYATGDGTARMSLRTVAGRILEGSLDVLQATARHPILSRVVTRYVASRGGPFHAALTRERTNAWLAMLEVAESPVSDSADLLAWSAYQVGDFAAAERWLKRASPDSAGTLWLRAKLLLREGGLEDAAALLSEAIQRFPATDDWPRASFPDDLAENAVVAFDQAQGELAALQMTRGECLAALDLLLQAGFWTDAAYVAERVLSIEELLAFVKDQEHAALRHLLARRLVRLGRDAEAWKFFPAALRPDLDEYAMARRKGDAASLWQAARILRTQGMAMMGTELAPDWHIHEGDYAWGYDYENRLAPVTEDVQPPVRFHYRYRAAALAWEAARMMPDNSEETARVLCEAGSWLKDRDPAAADRFYKTLVIRCRRTRLGQEADRLRWFPPLEDEVL